MKPQRSRLSNDSHGDVTDLLCTARSVLVRLSLDFRREERELARGRESTRGCHSKHVGVFIMDELIAPV